jgi:hypothetical protein
MVSIEEKIYTLGHQSRGLAPESTLKIMALIYTFNKALLVPNGKRVNVRIKSLSLDIIESIYGIVENERRSKIN